MKPLKTIMLLTVMAASFATVQAKTKKPDQLPAAFNQARYVYVEEMDGRESDPRSAPEDRQAIADVNKALDDWHRYAPANQRDRADLIIVVRKGRAAEANAGVHAGSEQQGAPGRTAQQPFPGDGVGGEIGAEAGSPDDVLEVYLPNGNGGYGALLWRRTLENGLNAPRLMLLKQLKDEVEHDYPSQNATTASKP